MTQLLEEDNKVEGNDSISESPVYSTLVSLLQGRKKSGIEAAIREIVEYGKQGKSNTKKQIRGASLKEWSDAIHHTWIGELDEKEFNQALKAVNRFSKYEIDLCISNYFKKYVLNIDSHGLSSAQVVDAPATDVLVVHAFGNPIKEECLDEDIEPFDASGFVELNPDGSPENEKVVANHSPKLDLYEDQEIEFSFTTTDNSKVFIEAFDVSVSNESGEVVLDSMTNINNSHPYLQLCKCHVLKSIANSTLKIRMVFRLGEAPEEYLYLTG